MSLRSHRHAATAVYYLHKDGALAEEVGHDLECFTEELSACTEREKLYRNLQRNVAFLYS